MDFGYLAPSSIEEAVSLLVRYAGEARVIAGGTDLLVDMNQKKAMPRFLVDLTTVPGLEGIDRDPVRGVRIGPLTTIGALARSDAFSGGRALVRKAATFFANPAITNMGTLGGNLCNAAPSADMAPGLIGLSALVTIAGPDGERGLPLEKFFVGSGRTVLRLGEIMTGLRVPVPPAGTRGVYLKYAVRDKCDLPIVGVAVVIDIDPQNRVCREIRLVLGNVAPTPMRARRAEEVLRGKEIHPAAIARCAEFAAQEAHPRSGSMRASPRYKKAMVEVFARRAIEEAILTNGDRKVAVYGRSDLTQMRVG